MGYFKDTAKGFSWMGGFRLFSRLVALGRTAILARILLPSQFGVYGVATLVLASLETFTDTGINVFLIQEKDRIEKYVDTAWVVSILRGAIIALFAIALTPFIASFFDSPGVEPLILLIALVSFIRGFINPSRVRFQKYLEFGKEFWFRSVIFLVDSTVAVVLALTLKSPISLVWGLTAGAILEVILSFIFLKPTPKFSVDTKKFKKIIKRGKWVTSAGIFNYLFSQGDDIVVGRIMNTASLGFYQMAYRISTLPMTEISGVFNKVTFPIYSKIADDKRRLKRAYFKVLAVTTLLVVPMGLVLFFFAEEVVLLVLGNQWLNAVEALKVLSVFGVVRAISGSSSSLFLAVKKQEYVSAMTFISIVGLGVSIIPLVLRYGIVGAGISAIIGSVFALPVIIYFLIRVLK